MYLILLVTVIVVNFKISVFTLDKIMAIVLSALCVIVFQVFAIAQKECIDSFYSQVLGLLFSWNFCNSCIEILIYSLSFDMKVLFSFSFATSVCQRVDYTTLKF